MADYTAKKIDDMEAIMQGGFKLARAELGVESFGMQIIDMPPDYADYPEHDHARPARKRSTWSCAGSAEMDVDGETRAASTPTRSSASGPARSARSPRATRACGCSRSAERRAGLRGARDHAARHAGPDLAMTLAVDRSSSRCGRSGRRRRPASRRRCARGRPRTARRRPPRGSPPGRCGASSPGSGRRRRPARAPTRARAGPGVQPFSAASSSTLAASFRFCSSASPWKRGPWRRKSFSSRSSGDLKRPDRKPRPSGEYGDEPDAQLAAGRQDLGLGVTRPQRVLRLERRDRVDRVRAAQRLGRGLAQPDVAHLALLDHAPPSRRRSPRCPC